MDVSTQFYKSTRQHLFLSTLIDSFKLYANITHQIKSNQIESNRIESNQIKSNQIKSNQMKQLGRVQGHPVVTWVRYHEPNQHIIHLPISAYNEGPENIII